MSDRETLASTETECAQQARPFHSASDVQAEDLEWRLKALQSGPAKHTKASLPLDNAAGAGGDKSRRRYLERRAPFRVAKELRSRIETGVYLHGDRLPTEQSLLFEFQVSRPALREAIIILECQGFIKSSPGIGYRIACPNPLTREAIAGRVDCIALLEACRMFETEAAALASCVAGRQRLASPAGEGRTPLDACSQFHIALAQAAGNIAVAVSIRNLWELAHKRSEMCAVLNAALAQVENPVSELRRRVIDAADNGDPQAARERMRMLFNCYLDGVLNLEEHERVLQARTQSRALWRYWRHRLTHQNQGLLVPARTR